MKLDLTQPIVVGGKTYEHDEVYQRKLFLFGAEPTDYEDYRYVNLLVLHKNRKDGAGGMGQVVYRHLDLQDLSKFNSHQYPYYIDVVMTTLTDKKGQPIQVILHADFASIQEVQMLPKKSTSVLKNDVKV